jgi:hypothetical protein
MLPFRLTNHLVGLLGPLACSVARCQTNIISCHGPSFIISSSAPQELPQAPSTTKLVMAMKGIPRQMIQQLSSIEKRQKFDESMNVEEDPTDKLLSQSCLPQQIDQKT